MNSTQLSFDFDSIKAAKKKKTPRAKKAPINNIDCPCCTKVIDLSLQQVRDTKACPDCGDRTWLLNLKTAQACFLYRVNPETLGGRLRDEKCN